MTGSRANRIDALRAPLFVSWQLTRDCDLCCLHCCTESAPGKPLADELDEAEAMRVVGEIVRNEVPYVMLCGGEPLVVPHVFAIAEALGEAGVQLKIETNGQRLTPAVVARLARLPIRSVQISLDADTDDAYRRQRPGGSLAKVHDACRAVRDAGLPLEVTFAPTRINIDQVEQVLDRARALGAFRFNSGTLMRIGTAARQWRALEPTPAQYGAFFAALDRAARFAGPMELCYSPRDIAGALRNCLHEPPATLLVLPNGWVKVAAALPQVCGDLRRDPLDDAWRAYCAAWHDDDVLDAVQRAIDDGSRHADANRWTWLPVVNA